VRKGRADDDEQIHQMDGAAFAPALAITAITLALHGTTTTGAAWRWN